MSKSRKLTTVLAVGAIGIGTALVAGPAVAHDKADAPSSTSGKAANAGKDDAGVAERKAARRGERVARRASHKQFRREMRKTRRMSRHVMRHCEIAPERLLTTETSQRLGLIKQLLDLRVAEGDLSQEHADAIFEYRQMRVTLKTAAKMAKHAPMLELFGTKTRKELRDLAEAAGGKRALMKSKGISKMDYRAAKREGMLARYQVVVDLCNSGAAKPAEEKPAGEKPAEEAPNGTPKARDGSGQGNTK